jgi:hypothetical protein
VVVAEVEEVEAASSGGSILKSIDRIVSRRFSARVVSFGRGTGYMRRVR